jgi:hypothetical protein
MKYMRMRHGWNPYSPDGFADQPEDNIELVRMERYQRIRRMKKRVYNWIETIKPVVQRYRMVMITLTYRPGENYHPLHISEYLYNLRSYILQQQRGAGGAGVPAVLLKAYAWTAELQERGAVHYHVLLVVERGTDIPRPDNPGMWAHGMTKIEEARKPWYIAKYASKGGKKIEYPKGIRIFAVWISEGMLDKKSLWLWRLSKLPAWMINLGKTYYDQFNGETIRKVYGGYEIGELILPNPWQYLGTQEINSKNENGEK